MNYLPIVILIIGLSTLFLLYYLVPKINKWIQIHKKAVKHIVTIATVSAATFTLLPLATYVEGDADTDVVWFTSSMRNAFFTTNTTGEKVNFSSITVAPYYVQFNDSDFNISCTQRVNVTIMSINSNIAGASNGDTVMDFYGYTKQGALQGASSNWWNTDYLYRKELKITNPLAEYQMNFTVWKADGHDDVANNTIDCESHCNDNFSDIRFIYDNTTVLDYWIENYTSATCAVFWINTSVSNYSNPLQMYYGNSGVGNASDGNTTFDFFDDFETALDGNRWDTIQGSISTSNGKLEVVGTTSTRGLIESTTAISIGAALHVFAKWGDASQGATHFCAMRKSEDWNDRVEIYGDSLSDKVNIKTIKEGIETSSLDVAVSGQEDNYMIWKIYWYTDNAYYYYKDTTELAHHTTNVPTTNLDVTIYEGNANGDTLYIDWVFVRKYSATEPFWSDLQNEEAYNAGSRSNPNVFFNITGFKANTNYNVTINGTATLDNTTNATGGLFFLYNFGSEKHFEILDNSSGAEQTHDTTIRNYGIDYFVWLGTNTSAWGVYHNLTGFDEATEYVAIWNATGSWWKCYYGTADASNNNWTITTFDVVQSYLDDSVGNQTFSMTENSDWNSSYEAFTYNLVDVGNGYNYTGWHNTSSTTLSAENTSIDIASGYSIALWNETNFNWNPWISHWAYNIDKNIHRWDVCVTKISQDRTWTQP